MKVDRQKIYNVIKAVGEEAKAVMMAAMASELGVNKKPRVNRNTIVEGKIFQEVGVEVEDLELVNILVNDYIQYIESGRRPGSFPPVSVIAKWAADKGITTDNNIVWAICQTIYKEGIAPRPIIDGNGGFWEQVDREWDNWSTTIFEAITEQLDNEFDNNFK